MPLFLPCACAIRHRSHLKTVTNENATPEAETPSEKYNILPTPKNVAVTSNKVLNVRSGEWQVTTGSGETTEEGRYIADRVGSEFWKQQVRFGDDVSGIHMTLTQSERGYPRPIEHVGIPQGVRNEKGWNWSPTHTTPVHYLWHKAQYLSERKSELQPIIDELDPHQPEFDGLEVVDSNQATIHPERQDTDIEFTDVFYKYPEEDQENEENFNDITREIITYKGDNSQLFINRIPEMDILKPGVILPSETMKVPFVFKSPSAGVFHEQWRFETRPTLCGGAVLIVTLRRIALQEDKFLKEHEELERDLQQIQAEQMVRQVMFDIISGIKTPDRPSSPVDNYITEEEIFARYNLKLHYNFTLVQQLKQMHLEMVLEEEREDRIWDLSIEDLKEDLLDMDEDDERKENFLHQLNTNVSKMAYTPHVPVKKNLYKVG
ncbi:MYCBP-associated protein-like [Argopecten irradians]|uniref:MYCBP-associated protein-like n=1 Tax=Argopecten irradians TaxID=31199 RepID=UPI00371428DA